MEDFDMDINTLKSFVIKHKIIVTVSSLFLIGVIAISGYLIHQHNKRVQFEREHPLVNKVYKYYYKHQSATGDWRIEEGYYIFGNNEYRDKLIDVNEDNNKVIDLNEDNGEIKYVREILHNKKIYKKEFSGSSCKYVFKNERELFPSPDSDNHFLMKEGKNWTGNWNEDTLQNEVKSGEIYMVTPVNID